MKEHLIMLMFCATAINCANDSALSNRIVIGKIAYLNGDATSQLIVEVYEVLMQPNLTDNNNGFEEHFITYGSSSIDQTGYFEVDCRDCPESAFIRVSSNENVLHWETISFQADTLKLGQIDIRPISDFEGRQSEINMIPIDIPIDTNITY